MCLWSLLVVDRRTGLQCFPTSASLHPGLSCHLSAALLPFVVETLSIQCSVPFRPLSLECSSSFFEKTHMQTLCFSLDYLSPYYWVVGGLYVFWLPVLYQLYDLQTCFSQAVTYLLTFLMVSFEVQQFLSFMRSDLSIHFIASVIGFVAKKSSPNPRSWRFTPFFCFFAVSVFIFEDLKFGCVVHFK